MVFYNKKKVFNDLFWIKNLEFMFILSSLGIYKRKIW